MEKLHITNVGCDTYFYIVKSDGKFQVWQDSPYSESLYSVEDSEDKALEIIENIN